MERPLEARRNHRGQANIDPRKRWRIAGKTVPLSGELHCANGTELGLVRCKQGGHVDRAAGPTSAAGMSRLAGNCRGCRQFSGGGQGERREIAVYFKVNLATAPGAGMAPAWRVGRWTGFQRRWHAGPRQRHGPGLGQPGVASGCCDGKLHLAGNHTCGVARDGSRGRRNSTPPPNLDVNVAGGRRIRKGPARSRWAVRRKDSQPKRGITTADRGGPHRMKCSSAAKGKSKSWDQAPGW